MDSKRFTNVAEDTKEAIVKTAKTATPDDILAGPEYPCKASHRMTSSEDVSIKHVRAIKSLEGQSDIMTTYTTCRLLRTQAPPIRAQS